MPESPPASRQVMLLILIVGLFAAVWCGDSAHIVSGNRQQPAPARSAIAVLMQTSAVVQQGDRREAEKVGPSMKTGDHLAVAGFASAAEALIVTTSCAADAVERDPDSNAAYPSQLPNEGRFAAAPAQLPVEAPVPASIATTAVNRNATVSSKPVEAPVPASRAIADRDRTDNSVMLESLASRVRCNYRMTYHSCREYLEGATRRMACGGRRTRGSLSRLAEALVQAIGRIDWSARLSAAPGDEPQRQF